MKNSCSYLVKSVFLMILILSSSDYLSQDFPEKISLYYTFGQVVPLSNYRANDKSINPFDIATKGKFTQSFNYGINFYLNPKIGISINWSYYRIGLDKDVFENLHESNSQLTESYLRKHSNGLFCLGLLTKKHHKRFTFEPNISVGYGVFDTEFSEAYIKNEHQEIIETFHYEYNEEFVKSLNGGVNTFFRVGELENLKLGFNLFTKLTYLKPEINYSLYYSNRETNTRELTVHRYQKSMFLFYFGLGVTLRL